MKRTLAAVLLGTVVVLGAAGCTESGTHVAAELDGVWKLQSYRLPEHDLQIAGMLIFKDDHFAMTYNMQAPEGDLSARSHSGTYRVSDERLVFEVEWWVEEVEGVSRIVAPLEDAPTMEYTGDDLVLTFGGGSVQHWRRLAPGTRHGSDQLSP